MNPSIGAISKWKYLLLRNYIAHILQKSTYELFHFDMREENDFSQIYCLKLDILRRKNDYFIVMQRVGIRLILNIC